MYKINAQTGELEQEIRAQFRDYFEECKQWFDTLMKLDAASESVFIPRKWWDFCVKALSMNYRLCPEIVGHLGLLDTANVLSVVLATVEMQLVKQVVSDLKKKTEPVSPVGDTQGVETGVNA